MKKLFIIYIFAVALLLDGVNAQGQTIYAEAEKIRTDYEIPELAYAVVSSDKVFEMKNLGVKKIGTKFFAETSDRFHLGSNTKAITGLLAALLVKDGKLNWQTKFFALFPELEKKSNSIYKTLTLEQLLTFRAPLPPFTYTNPLPKKEWFNGDDAAQRMQLTQWFLKQKPQKPADKLFLTNAGYILAGLMLERASGKSYKELVAELNQKIFVNFGFDYPNLNDYTQTWGHDANLQPLAPHADNKLNWLLVAGNINSTLADYGVFIQLQLRGLQGNSNLLTKEEFEFLHFGAPDFSVGWFWKKNENNHLVSYNTGNAGAYITQVFVIPEIDRAYILFANSASEKTLSGLKTLFDKLSNQYGK